MLSQWNYFKESTKNFVDSTKYFAECTICSNYFLTLTKNSLINIFVKPKANFFPTVADICLSRRISFLSVQITLKRVSVNPLNEIPHLSLKFFVSSIYPFFHEKRVSSRWGRTNVGSTDAWTCRLLLAKLNGRLHPHSLRSCRGNGQRI